MDDDRSRVPRNRLTRTSGLIERYTSDLHRRIHWRNLFNRTAKSTDHFVNRPRRHRAHRLARQDCSCRILRIGAFPESKHGTILLIPFNEIFSKASSPPDQHRQDSRCSRIESPGVADLQSAKQTTHLRHDVVRGPVGFLPYCEHAVHNGTALRKIHHHIPEYSELVFFSDELLSISVFP